MRLEEAERELNEALKRLEEVEGELKAAERGQGHLKGLKEIKGGSRAGSRMRKGNE
jgi:hypothetical protein